MAEQQTRNEPAERLRAALASYMQISADGEHFFDPEEELDAALREQTRITVEPLAKALERLFEAASVEEEDWSPRSQDELVAALNEAGAALAARLAPESPE